MIVYILTRRGVLHRGTRTESGVLLTPEGCNLDAATDRREAQYAAELPFKRHCRRCFGGR